MKEYNLEINSLIGGWFIPDNLCDDIVKFFNNNKKLQNKGNVGILKNENIFTKEINSDVKESTDLQIRSNYCDVPFADYRFFLQDCLNNYIKKYSDVDSNRKFDVNESYQIQHYKKGGGYKQWHYENVDNIKRLLVFMTYLNDNEDGGTHFKYQNLITPAKKGLTVIWPAGWTHTHKSQISTTNEKYIITGWFTFNDDE